MGLTGTSLGEDETGVIDLGHLSETMDTIARSRDLGQIFENIFDFVATLLDYRMMIIYRLNRAQEILEVFASRGISLSVARRRANFHLGEGVVGWVAQNKKAIVLDNALQKKEIVVRQVFPHDPPIRSFIAVPFLVENEVVGILSVSHSLPGQYGQKDVQMLSIVASQAAALFQLNNLLRDTMGFQHHILQSINNGVMVIDGEERIVVFNRAACRISGYDERQILGARLSDTPLKDQEEEWFLLETLRSRREFVEVETYFNHRDGGKIPIIINSSYLQDERDHIQGAVTIFRDNSEVKKLEEQVRRTHRLAGLGKLTAGIAHEIRNPLLSIRTAVDYLIQREETNEKRLIQLIQEEATRMNDLLNDFVRFARPGDWKRQPGNINELILDTLDFMEHRFDQSRIQVKTYLDPDLPLVLVDDDAMKQAFINLLLNGVEAQEEGGKIVIRTYAEHPFLVVTIKDTGVGIQEKDLEFIFDPFVTTKEEGTGLGLSIVYSIIKEMEGEIQVVSTQGKGTLFEIHLPLMKEEGP